MNKCSGRSCYWQNRLHRTLRIASANKTSFLEEKPDIDKVPAEMIQTGGDTLRSEIQNLICFIWNKEGFSQKGINLLLCLFIKRVKKLSVVIIEKFLEFTSIYRRSY
jgi:hypothetical protein